jgi:hypothetical protein
MRCYLSGVYSVDQIFSSASLLHFSAPIQESLAGAQRATAPVVFIMKALLMTHILVGGCFSPAGLIILLLRSAIRQLLLLKTLMLT